MRGAARWLGLQRIHSSAGIRYWPGCRIDLLLAQDGCEVSRVVACARGAPSHPIERAEMHRQPDGSIIGAGAPSHMLAPSSWLST